MWQDDRDDNGKYQIYVTGYNASGQRSFSEQTVNQVSAGQQLNPEVAVDDVGNFVVVWEDDQDKNGKYQIYAAGFYADGKRRFNDITVNKIASGQQRRPSVAMDDQSRFYVTFEDDNDKNGYYQIYAAGFNADGSRSFNDITVNQVAEGQQYKPKIVATPNGNFVVVWEDDQNKNNVYQILAAGFYKNGTRRFNDITINQVARGQQRNPEVAIDNIGRFVVTWEDDKDGNGRYQILMAGFKASGQKHLNDRTVNRNAKGQQLKPGITLSNTGQAIMVWQDDLDDNGYYEILNNAYQINW